MQYNTPEIIEIAYDLQAGSYIEYVKSNRSYWTNYTAEVASILKQYCDKKDKILDVGTR